MAETLVAIALITDSSRGSNLAFRWPPDPKVSPRLSRPKPDVQEFISQIDNPWRATGVQWAPDEQHDYGNDPEYAWERPPDLVECVNFSNENARLTAEYNSLFGYSTELLATLLCPLAKCHQKFELIVDDLAFIGHPVSANENEVWEFRGRERPAALGTVVEGEQSRNTVSRFQLSFVLDLPDPSSSASGNVLKYFDLIYEHIVFTFTAILYQEQVLSNFVEKECDALQSLKDRFIASGRPYTAFVDQALQTSSIAAAIKSVYEAIKASSIAHVTLNAIPLELQLPPHLDDLLHNDNDTELKPPEDDELEKWGPELSFGWKLPALVPWKSLLLLDANAEDPIASLRGPHVSLEDRTLAEGLIRFLETASVSVSLADMSTFLDWNLETQVYPVVRWLVQHRRAKVIDTVNTGLKTIFALPTTLPPLQPLAAEFAAQFSHPAIPPLPRIFSMISSSLAQQSNNHFFASVVKNKDLIPMYHDVVLWMLKRDLLITLHLRIRIVVSVEMKQRVWQRRQRHLAQKQQAATGNGTSGISQSLGGGFLNDRLPLFGAAKRKSRRLSSTDSSSRRSMISELVIHEDGEMEEEYEEEEETEETTGSEEEDRFVASMINDPGRATPLQRRWLSEMSVGKDMVIAKRFELINQYFDGKRSDDEILYRADITRRELREVLHAYEPHLQTFLHPS